ncbi:MAG: hypothetical protein JXQ75_04965 [Phycisphaerae bacterium]|nr:hypothetical protein [Phycisphaerae bacterium]
MNGTIDDGVLSQVTEPMRPALEEYAALVRSLAKGNVAGLTLFGAVLGPDFDTSRMAAASVMVLKHVDLKLLKQLAEHGPRLGSRHITAPLVMTPEYIAGSLDTFPLELLEIHQRHATLLGEDHFDALEFDAEHLRLQCEREFKRMLIQLRQGLLAAAGREKALSEFESDISQLLVRTLRGLLWLKGHKEPLPREEVVAKSEKLLGVPLGGVRGAVQSQGERGWADFTALYKDVEALAAVADEG